MGDFAVRCLSAVATIALALASEEEVLALWSGLD